ncbi:hypothetical protein FGO68_gene8283 [Halteria grandinella]|uniref:Uncharacterized protein n=1 Tax=Halteria grandinella TaxID=5974 RepID=A0A8J8P3R5_HALGN|nr:hypothetical protein FGO68_gene8283 [Halteria grandinella]
MAFLLLSTSLALSSFLMKPTLQLPTCGTAFFPYVLGSATQTDPTWMNVLAWHEKTKQIAWGGATTDRDLTKLAYAGYQKATLAVFQQGINNYAVKFAKYWDEPTNTNAASWSINSLAISGDGSIVAVQIQSVITHMMVFSMSDGSIISNRDISYNSHGSGYGVLIGQLRTILVTYEGSISSSSFIYVQNYINNGGSSIGGYMLSKMKAYQTTPTQAPEWFRETLVRTTYIHPIGLMFGEDESYLYSIGYDMGAKLVMISRVDTSTSETICDFKYTHADDGNISPTFAVPRTLILDGYTSYDHMLGIALRAQRSPGTLQFPTIIRILMKGDTPIEQQLFTLQIDISMYINVFPLDLMIHDINYMTLLLSSTDKSFYLVQLDLSPTSLGLTIMEPILQQLGDPLYYFGILISPDIFIVSFFSGQVRITSSFVPFYFPGTQSVLVSNEPNHSCMKLNSASTDFPVLGEYGLIIQADGIQFKPIVSRTITNYDFTIKSGFTTVMTDIVSSSLTTIAQLKCPQREFVFEVQTISDFTFQPNIGYKKGISYPDFVISQQCDDLNSANDIVASPSLITYSVQSMLGKTNLLYATTYDFTNKIMWIDNILDANRGISFVQLKGSISGTTLKATKTIKQIPIGEDSPSFMAPISLTVHVSLTHQLHPLPALILHASVAGVTIYIIDTSSNLPLPFVTDQSAGYRDDIRSLMFDMDQAGASMVGTYNNGEYLIQLVTQPTGERVNFPITISVINEPPKLKTYSDKICISVKVGEVVTYSISRQADVYDYEGHFAYLTITNIFQDSAISLILPSWIDLISTDQEFTFKFMPDSQISSIVIIHFQLSDDYSTNPMVYIIDVTIFGNEKLPKSIIGLLKPLDLSYEVHQPIFTELERKFSIDQIIALPADTNIEQIDISSMVPFIEFKNNMICLKDLSFKFNLTGNIIVTIRRIYQYIPQMLKISIPVTLYTRYNEDKIIYNSSNYEATISILKISQAGEVKLKIYGPFGISQLLLMIDNNTFQVTQYIQFPYEELQLFYEVSTKKQQSQIVRLQLLSYKVKFLLYNHIFRFPFRGQRQPLQRAFQQCKNNIKSPSTSRLGLQPYLKKKSVFFLYSKYKEVN